MLGYDPMKWRHLVELHDRDETIRIKGPNIKVVPAPCHGATGRHGAVSGGGERGGGVSEGRRKEAKKVEKVKRGGD